MRANHISITEAKQKLGELVKRANYGGERFVLEFRDKPQAAIVSFEDLERIESTDSTREEQLEVLKRLRALRERIAARGGGGLDSAREIEEMRNERVDHLSGLR